MTKYKFSFNGKEIGTVTFTSAGAEADFVQPSQQLHFMEEIELLKPTTIGELVRGGYSYYGIEEVKGSA
jgi:hypothetical protein